ncbi:MAG: sigma-70 family RNA polymerase sigma factor [Candidatus Delongbacteria bacterium]
MLPTKRTDALTPQSVADYLTLAAENAALPATLEAFLALLGPEGKDKNEERKAALATVLQKLQTGHPARASIQLWLLVAYAPLLRGLAGRYSRNGNEQADVESTVVVAFLETIQGTPEARLKDAFLQKRVLDDTKDRVRVHLGLRDYQQDNRIELVADDAVQEDRAPDERVDGYESLLAQINELPIAASDRDLLVGIYVYGYSMAELAERWHIPHDTVKKRYQRLLRRLKEKL